MEIFAGQLHARVQTRTLLLLVHKMNPQFQLAPRDETPGRMVCSLLGVIRSIGSLGLCRGDPPAHSRFGRPADLHLFLLQRCLEDRDGSWRLGCLSGRAFSRR